MTRSEIKRKIAQLIGGSFFSFSSYKTKEGSEFKVTGEKMEIGSPIYVITPEGELPVTDGDYELENGMKLKIKAGVIANIEDGLNPDGTPIDETAGDSVDDGLDEMGKTKMDEATLVDGTIVGTDGDFEIGKKLYVKDQDGNWVQAPTGEHTTESGIVLVVDEEGTITGLKKPEGEPQGSLEMSAEDLLVAFTETMKQLTTELSSLKQEHSILKEKFKKIAAEPAGERVFDRKGYFQHLEVEKNSKVEALASLKHKHKN